MFTIDQPTLSRAQAATRWRAFEPAYEDGVRYEMDEYGELFMAPRPTNRHQRIASQIAWQMQQQLGGTGMTLIAINTRIGVRVPDACWTAGAAARFDEDPASAAPEICVEVESPSNTQKWLLEKAAAYLDAGATEVIIVGLDERIRYFDASGERAASAFRLNLRGPF